MVPRAAFDVEASTALTDTQKGRVVLRAGEVLRAVAQDERSQLRNRELATDQLLNAVFLTIGMNDGSERQLSEDERKALQAMLLEKLA